MFPVSGGDGRPSQGGRETQGGTRPRPVSDAGGHRGEGGRSLCVAEVPTHYGVFSGPRGSSWRVREAMIVLAAFSVALAACAPSPSDTTLVLSADPKLRARVTDLLPKLASQAGMALVRPVRVEWRSRDELGRYLRLKLEEELPPLEARALAESYRHFGLLQGDLDLRDLLLKVYLEQVAGFYDPDSTALFLLNDLDEGMLETVLVHELVHAVQDQTANLDSLTAKARGNDRRTAAQAAIEGHATLVMLEYMTERARGGPLNLTDIPGFASALRPALEAMRTRYPALAGAPPVIQESLLFPYLEGASYVWGLWARNQARPAPFGPFLPQSTEQVLDPRKAWGPEADPPTELFLTAEGEYEILYSNTLGQMEMGVFLAHHLGEEGRALRKGWDGDRYVLLRGGGGEEGLAWAVVWDSTEDRNRFLEALRPALGRWAEGADLEPLAVGGRPLALLRVGSARQAPLKVELGPEG